MKKSIRFAIAATAVAALVLVATPANATGGSVRVKVIVDPNVLGGLVATVGDTVIDGTVRTRVEQLKSRL